MGDGPKRNRRAAMLHLGQPNAELTLGQVRSRFHVSPKRYLGDTRVYTVNEGVQQAPVSAQQIVQAAWRRLVDLTYDWRQRNPRRVTGGPFSRVVVTYPTVAPPAVRAEAERLVRELGFSEVVLDYDEAVAAALFYFYRELGGANDLGPELFKSQALSHHNSSYSQTVLVVDIGGGSTDIALLRLTMTEETPSEDHQRAGGGRYYVVTPRLLGSSGNRYLGGDLITLRVFELLKAALADRLLVAVQSHEVRDASAPAVGDLLNLIRDELPAEFVEGDGFQAGKLVDCVARLDEASPQRRKALQLAERVLPTRWAQNPNCSQAFFALWDLAEDAKVNSFAKGQPFSLNAEQIQAALAPFALGLELLPAVQIELGLSLFERSAEPIIEQAARIASGLVADRLARQGEEAGADFREPLDWVILSGKTSNLPLVREALERKFHAAGIRWNRSRLTFVPEYAKLATAAGACFAEKIKSKGVARSSANEMLQKGGNQMRLAISNLLWSLPCSFLFSTTNDTMVELFRADATELRRLDGTLLGKARSRPRGAQMLITVFRLDYPGAVPIPWYTLPIRDLARQLGQAPEAFTARLQVQFEVDHRQLMKAYVWEGKEGELPAHYVLAPQTPSLQVPPPVKEGKQTAAWCDLAVAVTPSLMANGKPTVVVKAGTPFDRTFHLGDELVAGLVVDLPDLFNAEERLPIHRQLPGETNWQLIEGSLERPDRNDNSGFPARYQLTLDEKGNVRIHRGMVPYWTVKAPEQWQSSPGSVLEIDPGVIDSPPPPSRDPFNGDH
jgi:hypothetical protein